MREVVVAHARKPFVQHWMDSNEVVCGKPLQIAGVLAQHHGVQTEKHVNSNQ